jgi:hypothetical protein
MDDMCGPQIESSTFIIIVTCTAVPSKPVFTGCQAWRRNRRRESGIDLPEAIKERG